MEILVSYEDYVWRRGHVLLSHPDYAHRGNAVWYDARPTADFIYHNQPELELPAALINARENIADITPRTNIEPRMSRLANIGYESLNNQQQIPDSNIQAAPDTALSAQPQIATHGSVITDVEEQQHQTPTAPLGNLLDIGQDPTFSPVPAPGVSALSNRPMHVPVKVKERPKRSISAVKYGLDAALISEDEGTSAKKARKSVVIPKKQSAKSTKKPEKAPKKQTEGAKSQNRRASTKQTPRRPVESIEVPPRFKQDVMFDNIVNGAALPRNRDEAMFAQAERKRRLLAEVAQKKATPAKKTRGKSKKSEVEETAIPDMMPEFFEVNNFPSGNKNKKKKKDEEDVIRCICMIEDEGNSIWIGCDTCHVWQHSLCMGEAVPDNLQKDAYFCHVCDPWGHRVLLQRLRQAASV